ncbi:ATP-binding cassette domain-containing protein [Auraticoccus sp. F435]|uniref:ATP-binding cassette domain-containing protein n=1 Tax=Auraticoccus cholistanensis TaxID=2656650 RepID=A0A6A9V065_9ACTN|nr:ABC transporter ATP-binding protein [Auraticoccus cholistanensis]MVA74880.1 ATP-binding cassette domain-containing protein [Auraticoccus cholistanensis]
MSSAGVCIGYGHGDVVSDVSLQLEPGRVTALVGPNGSGKSTLLRGLARLQRLSAGTVRVGDHEVDALSSRELARRLTVLAQSRPTPQGITVRDAVELGRHPHRGRWRSRDPHGPAVVERAMGLTGVAALAEEDVDSLSGGQLQRVWLASCLAQDTAVLMLDEPTNHLDLRYQVELLDLLRDLADDHGVTIGVVLHDLNHAARVADVIAVLAEGRVVACGAPEDVLTADVLSEVYGIDIAVARDPEHGHLEVRPRSRGRGPGRLHGDRALVAV